MRWFFSTEPLLPEHRLAGPQVGVVAHEPVHPERAERVEVVRLLEGHGRMDDVWRDDEDLAGEYCCVFTVDGELERPAHDHRDLLGYVLVRWHDRAFLKMEAADHLVLSDGQLPCDLVVELL